MRTPKITATRVVGLAAAAALAVAATLVTAQSSQAAVTALKLSPSTGGPLAGKVISVTGKDFETAGGASKVGSVFFSASTCTVTPTVSLATTTSIVSATKMVITAPALTGTAIKGTVYNLCITNTGDAEVIGSGKYTVYPAPTIASLSTSSGASYGGSTLTVTGENFTTKTTVKVAGKAMTGIKVVIGSGSNDDTVTGIVPAGTGTNVDVAVTTPGGTATDSTFDYVDAIKVTPTSGDGAINDVISITGTGFDDRDFATTVAAGESVIRLVPAGTNIAAGQTLPTIACGSIQKVSDSELACQLVAPVTDGAYTVTLFERGATPAQVGVTGTTATSKSATYTVADF